MTYDKLLNLSDLSYSVLNMGLMVVSLSQN